ncbi:MAG TPA: hypothetical protein VLD19_21315 [Chitinophagaceae bacterium]|nr:hypothetical protein [Chitinophagaceae bacterium]
MKAILLPRLLVVLVLSLTIVSSSAQQITGVWKGKNKGSRIELKLVKSGDSLVGNAYYYSSKNNYRKYSIKGYFDPETNNVIWWDDVLVEDKGAHGLLGSSLPDALLTVADFNCPGETEMRLDGTSSLRDDKEINRGPMNLQKSGSPMFPDDWDWVIDNYTSGTNDPVIIDSIAQLTAGLKPWPEEKLMPSAGPPAPAPQPGQASIAPPAPPPAPEPTTAQTVNEKKFSTRKKNLQTVIPFNPNKTIELRFYDNAAIDGDSIAIFLNGKLVREHILLGGEPQIIKLDASQLQDDNEVVLVAENLGSIPPNTSYLVAVVGNKKYEARLFADEHSSALIRFIKDSKQGKQED